MRLAAGRLVVWLALVLLPQRGFAADLPDPWVELGADGALSLRVLVPDGAACPAMAADGQPLTVRPGIAPDDQFPVRLCAASAPAGAQRLEVAGLPAPTLPAAIRRLVVIGDTGCRIKNSAVQDCNDPAAWRFARIARLAALQRPDLVLHVGDYHYRESPCPAGRAGCAGSPSGDNWAVWKADFFTPAAPLLAAAPWVMVRGNHELCGRGGHGWFRLLDPHPEPLDCPDSTAPYVLRLPPLDLLVLDVAGADDRRAAPDQVARYREQLATLFAAAAPHAWLLTHRPVWAFAQGQGVPAGAVLNATLQAAIAGQVPAALDRVVSGHVHDFASYDFGPDRPAQLIVGDGGDASDAIVNPPAPGSVIDERPVRAAFGVRDYGYLVLDRDGDGWAGTVRSATDAVLARCRFAGREAACRAAE